jgi:hypothetical protein
MLAQLLRELGPAARVLVLELHARGAERVLLRCLRPVRFERCGRRLALGSEFVLLVGFCAVAAAGDDERARALRIREPDVQRREAAHRQSDHMRAFDLEVIQHRDRVVARVVLRVALRVVRNVRGRKPARGIADAAEVAREEAHLRLPAAMVAGELVDEDHRVTAARFLVVETGSIARLGVRH